MNADEASITSGQKRRSSGSSRKTPVDHALGHHGILTTNRYTHLTSQTEALATQRIGALMDRFNLSWGALK